MNTPTTWIQITLVLMAIFQILLWFALNNLTKAIQTQNDIIRRHLRRKEPTE